MRNLEVINSWKTDLNKWMEHNHLTAKRQAYGLMGNLHEELSEYYRATSDEERVDALCDIIVFALNSIDKEIFDEYYKELLQPRLEIFNYGIEYVQESIYNIEYIGEDFVSYGSILQLVIYATNLIEYMGYDYDKCMKETIKEISSRRGSFNKGINKWIKDTSDEAKAKWYEADYASCKL